MRLLLSLPSTASRKIPGVRYRHSNVPKASCLQKHYPRLLELIHNLQTKDGILPLLNEKQHDEMTARTKEVSSLHQKERREAAAVLVLLCSVNDQPSILFTKRAAHLKSHAAEMAFVGGHYDESAGDRSLIDTAIREAQEELLPHSILFSSPSFVDSLEILGECTPLPSLYGTPVTPVLALLWPDLTLPLSDYFPGDPSEVETVLAVSIQDLVDNETTRKLPANQFRLIDAPVYPTPYGDVWGLTAYILRPLLRRIFRRAFEPRDQAS